MDQKMTPDKALWHALMTVGLGVLLVAGFVLYVGSRSAFWPAFVDLWPVLAIIFLVTALILLPFVYRKYRNGPPPPLTRRQHLERAAFLGVLACVYTLLIVFDNEPARHLVWKWLIAGGWLVSGLDHLRRAYKRKEESPSPAQ